MIELKNLSAGYGRKPIVKNVSCTFPEGQVTVLLGPNGCGKTTLLRVLARLLQPESGQVLLEGRAISDFGRTEYARRVSMLPQVRGIPNLPVADFVLHGRFPYLGLSRKPREKDYAVAEDAMHRAGVWEMREKNVAELSGGERQKVYIAMVMAQDTETVLLDEPTTYLDIGRQYEILELVRSLQHSGKTVIVALHDLPHALEYGDRLMVMNSGQLCMTGSPQEILQSEILNRLFQVKIQRTSDGAYYCTHK